VRDLPCGDLRIYFAFEVRPSTFDLQRSTFDASTVAAAAA